MKLNRLWPIAALIGLAAVPLTRFEHAPAAAEPTRQNSPEPQGIPVEIIGHRGASYDAPENTLASVNLAWKQGADAVEIDVRLTADGQIVALHDDNTKRTGDVALPVVTRTLDELRAVDLGRWKHERFTGERIATLDEILATVPAGKRLFIEVKCGDEIVPELKRALHESSLRPEQAAIIGFSRETMQAVKQAVPERKVYWIVRLRRHEETGELVPSLGNFIHRTKEAGLDGLDFGMSDAINADLVREVKAAGLGVYVWTINSADEARHLAGSGIEGITTDRPGWLRQQLESSAE